MDVYSVFAAYYDDIMSDIPYGEWVDYIEMLMQRHGIQAEHVLDLACGTGTVARILGRRGYRVTGVDRSTDMLAQAKKKCTGYDIDFINSDMRDFALGRSRVDLVLCLYDSLNYILKEDELNSVFASVRQALRKGGYFIFDLNSEEGIKEIASESSLLEGPGYRCLWRNMVDREQVRWTVILNFLIKDEDGSHRVKTEVHREAGYTSSLIAGKLEEEGLEPVAAYRAYTFEEVETGRGGQEDPPRIFFVARCGV